MTEMQYMFEYVVYRGAYAFCAMLQMLKMYHFCAKIIMNLSPLKRSTQNDIISFIYIEER